MAHQRAWRVGALERCCAKKMARKRTTIIFATFLLVGASVVALIPATIEWSGKRNTEYGARYVENQFDRIPVGMAARSVEGLIGEPISRTTHSDYPVWALREDSVRERLGRGKNIEVEVWSYSMPKNPHRDYELIHVAFGPSKEVLGKERWVTD